MILNLQAWRDSHSTLPWTQDWEDGHYVVLVGMDSRQAYVMDPSTSAAYAYLPLTELVVRWHDYENRQGFRREYHHAAIFIHGHRYATRYPLPLVRLKLREGLRASLALYHRKASARHCARRAGLPHRGCQRTAQKDSALPPG